MVHLFYLPSLITLHPDTVLLILDYHVYIPNVEQYIFILYMSTQKRELPSHLFQITRFKDNPIYPSQFIIQENPCPILPPYISSPTSGSDKLVCHRCDLQRIRPICQHGLMEIAIFHTSHPLPYLQCKKLVDRTSSTVEI